MIGAVLFNAPDDNGEPSFSTSSANTPIPIGGRTSGLGSAVGQGPVRSMAQPTIVADANYSVAAVAETLLRWLAPYDGVVVLAGAATLTNLSLSTNTSTMAVRVAVQQNNQELGFTVLTVDTLDQPVDLLPKVGEVKVSKGDRLYFRVGSLPEGCGGVVRWSPLVTYASFGSVPPSPAFVDSNGRRFDVFSPTADFVNTTGGWHWSTALLPYTGTIRLVSGVTKSGTTTDDVTMTLLLSPSPSGDSVVPLVSATVPGSLVGQADVSQLPVVPVANGSYVSAYLAIDSRVDYRVLNWLPVFEYTFQVGTPKEGEGTGCDAWKCSCVHVCVFAHSTRACGLGASLAMV